MHEIFQKHYRSETYHLKIVLIIFLQIVVFKNNLSDFSVKDIDILQLVSRSFHPERFNNMVGQFTAQQVKDIYYDIL